MNDAERFIQERLKAEPPSAAAIERLRQRFERLRSSLAEQAAGRPRGRPSPVRLFRRSLDSCLSEDSDTREGGVRTMRQQGLDPQPSRLRHYLGATLDRRNFLRAAIQGSLATAGTVSLIPLLAACGGDDEDPTATAGSDTATATTGSDAATPTTASETTPTAAAEATATGALAEPTATEAMEEPTAAPTEGTEPTEIYGFPIEPAQSEGGTLVRGVQYLGSSWAPWHLVGYSYIGVHEGLASLHPETGEPVPLLATGWEVADDARSWTFDLRQGVSFHNGEPFQAEDVVFSIQLEQVAAAVAFPISDATVSAPDAETVVFEFPEPATNILFPLYYSRVRSRAFHADIDPATIDWETYIAGFEGTVVDPELVNGTGPFRFAGGEAGVSEMVSRYEGYWGGPPHLDEIIFQLFASVDLYIPSLQTGALDMAGEQWGPINPAQAGELDPEQFTVTDYNMNTAYALEINHSPDRVWFQDVRVRQALLYAADREAMIDPVTYGFGAVADSPITASWAYDPDGITARYPYDPEQAAALLDEAGWVLGDDGVRAKDGQRLSFTANYISGNAPAETLGVILQEQWRAVGIECALEGLDTAAYYDLREAFDYDLMVGEVYTEYAGLWYHYGCGPATYATGVWNYCNAELDALLTEAAATADPEQHRALVTEAANLVMEDLPAVPLITKPGLMAVSTRVHNVYPNVYDLMFNAQTWWMEA
jgi:peptide/nickel transport system substrate-binding protein